jgi:hypothetical protein
MAVTSIGLLDTFGDWVVDFNRVGSDVGDIIQLETPVKSNLVSAINSIDSDFIRGIIDSDYLATTLSTGGIAANTTITDDTSTDASFYITLTDITSGTENTLNVSSTKLYFNPSTGQLNSTDYNSLSDRNKKENVETLVDAINVINQINPVSFTWKDNGNKAYGVIAQEIEEVLPDIVSTSSEGVKSVSYTQIIPFLVQVIQEQHKEIQRIKAVVDLD